MISLVERINRKAIEGIVKIREIPSDCSEADFQAWWPRLTEKERNRRNAGIGVPRMRFNLWTRRMEWTGEYRQEEEAHNLITNLGITALLQLIDFGLTAQLHPYQQIMSVGNVPLSGVTRADTAVPGDAFVASARKVPTAHSEVGFQGTHSTLYGATDAVATWYSAGWYGYNFAMSQDATTTGGTGALMTHVMLLFVKPNTTAYTLDYVNILAN